MSTEDQRRRWKEHWQEFHQLSSAWQERGYSGSAPTYPALPDDLIGMTCGAVTRAGTPCKQKAIYRNGRCKFHGGLATGPVTEAGKEQARINGRNGGRPRKAGVPEAEALPQQGAQLLKDVRVSEAVIETEAPDREMSTDVHVLAVAGQPEIIPEKPKSWMLKEAIVLAMCARCEMLASNGACLAVAKGVIPCIPAGDTCAGFIDFGSA